MGYLDQHPDATLADIQVAGTDARRDAYQWLFRTERLGAQNRRIRTVLEQDAFEALHRQWQRLGYPFDSLVPSYATALGASADRPSALAELTGIILNNGMRLPTRKIERLHFAEDTPYETEFEHRPEAGERVLSPEVSQTARQALVEVVAAGTGRRAQGVFQTPGGEPLTLGGKTGTADHRSKIFAPGGRLVDSRAVNRNAIFTFFIGDRYFGNLMVHVGGAKAEDFAFTSALPVQLFVSLEPALQPLLAVGEHHMVSAR